MKYLILLVLIAGGFWYYQQNNAGSRSVNIKKTDLSNQTQEIISKAETKPSTKNLQDLSGAFYKAQDPDVKAFLARLISLGFLSKDPNAFRRFKMTMEKKYPNEGYFDFLDDEFPTICSRCDGKGGDPCSKCKGKAKCTNIKCDGGRIRYESFDGKIEDRECVICKGKAICMTCVGSGVSDKACVSCKGAGRKGARDKAARLYKETLNKFK